MRLIEFFQPIAVPKMRRVSIPLYYLGGSYREYKNYLSSRLVESVMVNEAAIDRYRPMLRFFDTYPNVVTKRAVEKPLQWAMRVLKRDDRIVWYLRLVKMANLQWLVDMESVDTEPEMAELLAREYKRSYDKLLRIYSTTTEVDHTVTPFLRAQTVMTTLEHYLSMNIPAINATVWGNQSYSALVAHFDTIEQDWINAKKSTVDTSTDQDSSNFEILIQFPDGSAWIDLHRSSCEIEGDAMGHCGNTATDGATETVLSYREPVDAGGRKITVKNGNYTGTTWKPRLTFILNKATGNLGEMKGRANKKPKDELHPKIIALLKLDMIKGIAGGGYAPENNFALSDLSPDDKTVLLAEKPALGNLAELYDTTGWNQMVMHKLIAELEGAGIDLEGNTYNTDIGKSSLLVSTSATVFDFVGTYMPNDTTVAWIATTLYDGMDVYDYNSGDLEDRVDLADTYFTKYPDEKASLILYVTKNYVDDIEDGDYDVTDIKDIFTILDEASDDIYIEFGRAISSGYESGAYANMQSALYDWVDDPFNGVSSEYGYDLDATTNRLDGETIQLTIAPLPLIQQFAEYGPAEFDEMQQQGWVEILDFKDIHEPSYGWDEYDEDAAISSLRDYLEIPSTVRNKTQNSLNTT